MFFIINILLKHWKYMNLIKRTGRWRPFPIRLKIRRLQDNYELRIKNYESYEFESLRFFGIKPCKLYFFLVRKFRRVLSCSWTKEKTHHENSIQNGKANWNYLLKARKVLVKSLREELKRKALSERGLNIVETYGRTSLHVAESPTRRGTPQ